jgi:hypothetical protein
VTPLESPSSFGTDSSEAPPTFDAAFKQFQEKNRLSHVDNSSEILSSSEVIAQTYQTQIILFSLLFQISNSYLEEKMSPIKIEKDVKEASLPKVKELPETSIECQKSTTEEIDDSDEVVIELLN